MFEDKENCFYYITTMNENYVHPAMPEGAADGIIKGGYPLVQSPTSTGSSKKVILMGAGTILNEVLAAAVLLKEKFNVESDVWSLTSINELVREGQAIDRWNLLHPTEVPKQSYIESQLGEIVEPVVIATDYMKAYAEQLRRYIPSTLHVLGTDGFGRSDSRETLRRFFEVDRHFIAISALKGLSDKGIIEATVVSDAIKMFSIDPDKANPLYL